MTTSAATRSTMTIYPTLRYRDARKAVQWLVDAFGFEIGTVYPEQGETVDHAVVFYGNGGIMFGSDRDNAYPLSSSAESGMGMYVVVEDLDAHYQRATSAGAEVTIELGDTEYGSREYTARDFEGKLWSFGTYAPPRP